MKDLLTIQELNSLYDTVGSSNVWKAYHTNSVYILICAFLTDHTTSVIARPLAPDSDGQEQYRIAVYGHETNLKKLVEHYMLPEWVEITVKQGDHVSGIISANTMGPLDVGVAKLSFALSEILPDGFTQVKNEQWQHNLALLRKMMSKTPMCSYNSKCPHCGHKLIV